MSMATEPQVQFIAALANNKGVNAFVEIFNQIASVNAMYTFDDYTESVEDAARRLSKKNASNVISFLKAEPNLAAKTWKDSSPVPEAPEGMHRLADGSIYKVQRSTQSGRVYAKALVENNGSWSFEYAPGTVKILSERTLMTLDEAKEFGALYGTCCVCARTLTNEESIEAGIGPVCGGRLVA